MEKTVAVIFGGRSAEHDVSIITAHIPIIESLRAVGGYRIIPIYIDRSGLWYSDAAMIDLEFFQTKNLADRLKRLQPLRILLGKGLQIIWPGLRERRLSIDIAFPAMHGTYGEDGSLMGLLRLANIPFVGCDLSASAVAMDKVLTKQILEAAEVPVVPYVWCTRDEWKLKKSAIVDAATKLGEKLFVKPVHLGSSIGITLVTKRDELMDAIDVAFHYDDKVLIEVAIDPLIEVTLPIMGNSELTLGGIERPLTATSFLQFNDKYLSNAKTKNSSGVNTIFSEIPAKLPDELSKRINELGRTTYHVLGCSGIARIDFLIHSETNSVYVNEVNTLPGSLYHHNWRVTGISNTELVQRLITFAEERWKEQSSLTTSFNSDILRHVSGQKNRST